MDIETLRQRLADIDKQIIDLVGDRQSTAKQIGAIKQQNKVPTRDYSQERAVIERAKAYAKKASVSDSTTEEIMLALINASLTIQEKSSVSYQAQGTGKTVLLIGGNGLMGQWFFRFFTSQGFTVTVSDTSTSAQQTESHVDWQSLEELYHDYIVVCTPISLTNEILLAINEKQPKGIVFDICSLKSPLAEGLEALAKNNVAVTSLHPMFGPNTELLSGRHIIGVDVGSPKANQATRELFSSTMATFTEMSIENHDRLMAYVLGLSHATNIAFFSALTNSGETAPQLSGISSTTFDKQLQVSHQVAQENPDLYYEIQVLNRYGQESLAALAHAIQRIAATVRSKNHDDFVAMMLEGKKYLQTRLEQAPL